MDERPSYIGDPRCSRHLHLRLSFHRLLELGNTSETRQRRAIVASQKFLFVHRRYQIDGDIPAIHLTHNTAAPLLDRFGKCLDLEAGGAEQSIELLAQAHVKGRQITQHRRVVERGTQGTLDLANLLRSEERRVGKGGGSWGAPDECIKDI